MTAIWKQLSPTVPIDKSGESTTIVRIGSFVIIVLIGGFFTWASLAPISGAVIANGIVKIHANRKTIQHLEGGIVKEILVQEGSFVEKSQPLVVLEDTLTSSNLNILSNQLAAMLAKAARLLAERNLSGSISFPTTLSSGTGPKIADILRNEESLFRSRRKALIDQMKLLNEEIRQAKIEISGLTDQIAAIKEGIGYIKEQLSATETLQRKHFIDKSALWQIKRSFAEKKENLGSAVAKLAEAREKIAKLKRDIITLRNSYVEQADAELKETRGQIFDIEERLRPAKGALERETVVAPIAGQVIDLKVTTIGGVIAPGQELMELVPDANELIIEAKAKTKDVESIFVGQNASIQLSAYSRRKTPLVEGQVTYISGDALVDEIRPDNPYYLVHIAVDKQALKAIGDLNLLPGMPTVAFIKTRDRTFLDYILEPIVDNLRRSFREV